MNNKQKNDNDKRDKEAFCELGGLLSAPFRKAGNSRKRRKIRASG